MLLMHKCSLIKRVYINIVTKYIVIASVIYYLLQNIKWNLQKQSKGYYWEMYCEAVIISHT